MKKPYTVYFDTNFYVWLGRADEAIATDVVKNLNSLEVRHVLSNVLIRELLANGNRPNFDEVLVERVSRFKVPPYCTSQSLEWEGIRSLAPGRALRSEVGQLLNLFDSMLTEAHSYALTASRIAAGRLTREQLSEIEKTTAPFLEQHGLSFDPENTEETLRAGREFAQKLTSLFKDVLPEGPISGNLEWSDDPREDPTKLFELLDPKDIEAVSESSLLNESITSLEDRPYQVAAGIADSSTKRNLAHSLRDSEHMSTFILHRNDIDALQVDKAQMSLIKRPKPRHRLVELDLSGRCFSVSSIQEIVEAVRSMKQVIIP